MATDKQQPESLSRFIIKTAVVTVGAILVVLTGFGVYFAFWGFPYVQCPP